ncbi:hypothetical protein Tco_0021730 [Tanacetum coccineum]
MASMGSSPCLNTRTVRPNSKIQVVVVGGGELWEHIPIEGWMMFGISFDEFDKGIRSSDGLQPKQADLSCVHALNELHLHEIRVVPNKHEADQY